MYIHEDRRKMSAHARVAEKWRRIYMPNQGAYIYKRPVPNCKENMAI